MMANNPYGFAIRWGAEKDAQDLREAEERGSESVRKYLAARGELSNIGMAIAGANKSGGHVPFGG